MADIFDQLKTPKQYTLADKKSEVASVVIQQTQIFAMSLVQELNKLFVQIWGQQNQWGLTPPQVVDGLGENGLSLFRTHGAMVAALPSICPAVSFKPFEQGVQPGPLEVFIPPVDWEIQYETDDDNQPTGRVILVEVQ